MRVIFGPSLFFATLAAGAAPAAGQTTLLAQVSRSGTDSGTCGTTPCRTLAYAFSQTASTGRILCIDTLTSAGLTITRSVTIDCTGTNSTVASAVAEVIVIDDSATASPGTASVTIRGLAIDGVSLSARGIRFNTGLSLTVEDVRFSNFTADGNAAGISFAPSLAARLIVTNVSVTDSGGVAGAGIVIRPRNAGYASAVLENVVLSGNQTGLLVSTAGSTASSSTNAVVNRSILSSNAVHGLNISSVAGTPAVGVTVTNSTINGNADSGISASGPLSQVRVANTTIAGNSTGLRLFGTAIIASYGNNTLIGNGTNGSFNGFPSEN